MKFVSNFDCAKCSHNEVCRYHSDSVLSNLDIETALGKILPENLKVTVTCDNYLYSTNTRDVANVKICAGQDY